MESTSSFTEEEQVRRLERVFRIFADAQEDWATAHDLGNSTHDDEKEADASS
jgi:hypothetical protein